MSRQKKIGEKMIRTQKSENKIITSCQTAHKPILPMPTSKFNPKIRINFIDTVLVIDSKRFILHRDSKNVPHLACYNFDAHEWILIFFGRNVTDKVGNQKTLYYATSNNLCFCTTWQIADTRKSQFNSLNWIVLHTQCTCLLSS